MICSTSGDRGAARNTLIKDRVPSESNIEKNHRGKSNKTRNFNR